MLLLSLLALTTITPAFAMRLVTWNVRFDAQPNNITVQQSLDSLPSSLEQFDFLSVVGGAEQPWSTRRIRLAEILESEGVVLAGFQEALVRQVNDIQELFGDKWDFVGVGRDDGVEAGEFSPIFYRKDLFDLIDHEFFWTSNTPFEPSKFPDAGSFRICTVTQFRIRHSIKTFTVLNTHMDDRSDNQRRLAASMLLYRARYAAEKTHRPVIIMGDFNSLTFGADSGAYNIATGVQEPVPINATFAEKYAVRKGAKEFKMIDLRGEAPRRSVSNTLATFTGFTAPNDASRWTRIDFIFGGSNGGWDVSQYKVGNVMGDDGLLVSDHRPVYVDIEV